MTKPATSLTPPDPKNLENPPHYTIGENPHLTVFIETHLNHDEREPITAYTASKVGTKTSQLYGMHTYWSKKPYEAIEPYIMHYTKPGDIVLDPFSGSGSTALAAVMNKRYAVAIDLSPAATFITYHYTHPVDPQKLRAAYERLLRRIGDQLDWLYETKVNGLPSQTINTIYSDAISCPSCGTKIVVAEAAEIEVAKLDRSGDPVIKGGKTVIDKKLACSMCSFTFTTRELNKYERLPPTPIAVSVYVGGARVQRKVSEDDLAKLREIEGQEITCWFPEADFEYGYETHIKRNLPRQGVTEVKHLFTKRNLWALALCFDGALKEDNQAYKEYLRFAISSILLKASNLMALNNDGIGRIQKGTFYIAPKRLEINVQRFLEDTIGDLVRAEESRKTNTYSYSCISTQSATNLSNIPTESIDYVFTDPPYAGQVQYGELNFVWEAWLNLPTNYGQEIIENKARGKDLDEWKRLMIEAFSEVYRVLKSGRWCTLTYHDTDPKTWELLHDIMRQAGFLPDDADKVVSISTSQKSLNQMFANKNAQTDLVVNFYKPRYEGDKPQTVSFRDLSARGADIEAQVMQAIYDYLEQNPGQTKAQLYDAVISRLVRSGQIKEFDFDAILRRNESLLWILDKIYYLPGQEVPLDTSFLDWEGIADDKPERKVVAFITRFLSTGARSYSDILAAYTTSRRLSTVRVKLNDSTRNLDSLLEEGFVFEDEGQRWRNPNEEERENLQALAERKRERRVKRWLEMCREGRAPGVLASGDLLWELQRRYEEKDFAGILEIVGYAERSSSLPDEAQDYLFIARSMA